MEEPEKIVSQTELDDKAQKLVEEKDADSRLRVYAYAGEAYLNDVMMDKLGVSVMLLGETALVETR